MKKITITCVFSAVFLIAALSFAAADPATDVKIDYRMDLALKNHDADYFKWTVGTQTVQDKFDAASGASLKGSTKAFNAVRFAEPADARKASMPSGLRSVFLFAIADGSFVKSHALKVTDDAGVITVRFIRKTNAFELKTDKKGNFNLLTGSKIAKNVTDKKDDGFVIKPEYLKKGGDASNMADLDWNKLPFEADAFSPEAAYHYDGNVKFTFKNNVLNIVGTLSRTK
ncbi:hypothetical protein HRI96_06640 [Treponema parvum]|uniref:DUF3108 domain-containing protein n=1 Tax=Treponema parvum TaxID=138851 RepID=A0A975F019_9SPIR|nr:hypothetical protein [Treponema parvum]QTQ11903.1 hypothetical protein HRI96_06640 [Treponema parvum]QTQ16121.1 hypothetical protein HXT04_05110 [Treponema parvum]